MESAYTCPMHPEIRSAEPGSCPKCGMALVPSAPAAHQGGRIDWPLHRQMRWRGFAWGAAAGIFLLGVYTGTLALANSLDHAVREFIRLWAWMIPLVAGFSFQVGLFAYARGVASGLNADAHAHGVVASGGASTLSMVACCAHHLADILPLVGFAGAVSLLAAYQNVFLLAGVLSNLVGLIYVLGTLRRHGLFPDRKCLLSLILRWPIQRALAPAIVVSSIVLVIALITAAN